MDRKSVQLAGTSLSYLEWNRPTPGCASILCLHGLLATGQTLDLIAAPLARDRHVIAIDLPGNGASNSRAETDPSFTGLARLLVAFVRELKLQHPVVLGHSHGGALALQLVALDQSFAAGLVLLCPAHPFSGHEQVVVKFFLSPLGRLGAYLLPWLPRSVQLVGFRNMGRVARLNPSRWDPYRRNLQKRGMIRHTLRLLKSWNEDMDHLASALRRKPPQPPTLLLWGALDDVVPASTAAALVQYLPIASLQVLPHVGHLPNEEVPELCVDLIRLWLTQSGL